MPTDLSTPYRSHTCGQLRAADAGISARLSGWVHRRRDHGQLIFLDLRDRHGITQVVVDATESPEAHAVASRIRSEFVVSASGEVARRLPGTENPKLPTGEIELRASAIEILSEARTPPFYINEPDAPVDESVRLEYRYLDIRREPMQRRLLLRSRMVQAIREVHHAHGFVEVETPTLIKSTPEGARDFIVPSRLQPGSVYALPQSPQQLKQLLMVAGLDRYFQIARCYRDEDLRGDRQPEFTQLDLEMSFVDEATVMEFRRAGRHRGQQGDDTRAADPAGAVPGVHVRRGHRAVRLRQAGHPLRHGAGRPRAGARGWLGVPRVRRGARVGRPGQGDRRAGHGWCHAPRDRRADRAREAVRREGPRPPVDRGRRRGQGTHRQVPHAGGRDRDPGANRSERGRPHPRGRRHVRHHRRGSREAACRARRAARA